MKLAKKLIACFLAFVLVFGAMPAVSAETPFTILSFAAEGEIIDYGNMNNSVEWTLYSGGELVISGTGDMPYNQDSFAPWFNYRSIITSVTVEEGITSVAPYSFYALYNAASVTLPEGITTIGAMSFYQMLRLKEIVIPSTVKSIDLYAFNSCVSLEKIILPDGLEKLIYAFPYCVSLQELIIPGTLKTFMPGSLAGCYSLKKLVISEGVSFTITDDNTSGLAPEEMEYDKATADEIIINEWNSVADYLQSLEYLEIPSTITTDGIISLNAPFLKELHNKSKSLAFALTGDMLLSEDAAISVKAERNLSFMASIYDLLTSFLDEEQGGIKVFSDFDINEFMYDFCGFDISILNEANPDIDEMLSYYSAICEKEIKSLAEFSYHYQKGVSFFSGFANNTLIYCYDNSLQHSIIDKNDLSSYSRHILLDNNQECSDELILSKTYEATEDHGEFSYEVDVESRTLILSGDGAMPEWTEAEQPGYVNCSHLYDKVIFEEGSNITNISSYAFLGSKMTEVHIPSSVEYIDDSAFFGCSNLSVYISKDCSFDPQCFIQPRIKEVIVEEGHRRYFSYDGALYDTYPLLYEDGYGILTEIDGPVLTFVPQEKTDIIISEKAKAIGPMAFNMSDIETVTIPDTVEFLLLSFYICPYLKNIHLGSGVKPFEGGDLAIFAMYCSALTTITVNENNEDYYADENGVLFSKDKKTLVNYPSGKTEKTYTVPDGVSVISSGAFVEKEKLASIILPQSVQKVEAGAIFADFAIKEVTFLNSETEIYDSADTIGTENTVIYGFAGSTAQKYAEKYNRTFIEISDCQHVGGEATCESLAVCDLCGQEYGTLGEHIEDSYTENESCTVNGYTLTYCIVCYEELGFEVIEAKHLWPENHTEVTPATCTQEGLEKRTCQRCPEEDSRAIPMAEHDYSEQYTVDVKATCTENGSKSRHCKNCTAVTDVTEITAPGHSFGDWYTIKDATFTDEGKKERKCNVCQHTEQDIIPVLIQKEYEDKDSGIKVTVSKGAYEGKDIEVDIKEVFDGSHYLTLSYTKKAAFDITTLVDGEEAQPGVPVYVQIPVPSDFNKKSIAVFHVNSVTDERERINAEVIDGYICFYASSFSVYIVVDESTAIEDEPVHDCDHLCHKTGFLGFIWKIILFFNKLFKINPVCNCGNAHY